MLLNYIALLSHAVTESSLIVLNTINIAVTESSLKLLNTINTAVMCCH